MSAMNLNLNFQTDDEFLTHITDICFGPEIKNNLLVTQALRNAIPLFNNMISTTPCTNLNIREIHEISSMLMGENVGSLNRKVERRLCFEVLFVLLLFSKDDLSHLKWPNIPRLLESYPEFAASSQISVIEQHRLLNFRNMMVFAMLMLVPSNHKTHLLELVTRIVEGKYQKYITGSGETLATKNRVYVYRMEGQVTKAPRPPRKEKNPDEPVLEKEKILKVKKEPKMKTEKAEKPEKKRKLVGPEEVIGESHKVLKSEGQGPKKLTKKEKKALQDQALATDAMQGSSSNTNALLARAFSSTDGAFDMDPAFANPSCSLVRDQSFGMSDFDRTTGQNDLFRTTSIGIIQTSRPPHSINDVLGGSTSSYSSVGSNYSSGSSQPRSRLLSAGRTISDGINSFWDWPVSSEDPQEALACAKEIEKNYLAGTTEGDEDRKTGCESDAPNRTNSLGRETSAFTSEFWCSFVESALGVNSSPLPASDTINDTGTIPDAGLQVLQDTPVS